MKIVVRVPTNRVLGNKQVDRRGSIRYSNLIAEVFERCPIIEGRFYVAKNEAGCVARRPAIGPFAGDAAIDACGSGESDLWGAAIEFLFDRVDHVARGRSLD
jgi:hypothetical protein